MLLDVVRVDNKACVLCLRCACFLNKVCFMLLMFCFLNMSQYLFCVCVDAYDALQHSKGFLHCNMHG